jgi:hypothetical protein
MENRTGIFRDANGKPSMGRILSFSLFVTVTVLWVVWKFVGVELYPGDYDLIKWGWIAALGGKAIQAFAEAKK